MRMNLVAFVLLTLHLIIVSSCVDAGKVVLLVPNISRSFLDMEAEFSPSVKESVETGVLYVAEPLDACRNLRNKPKQGPNDILPFVLIARGHCNFDYKVRNAQRSGFKAAIVYDNQYRINLFKMGGDSDGIKIRAVSVTKVAGETLKKHASSAQAKVMLARRLEDSVWPPMALFLLLTGFALLTIGTFVYRECTRHRMVKAKPSVTFTSSKEDNTTAFACAICIEDYNAGDKLRVLPCGHMFHAACIDSTLWRKFCAVCKQEARTNADESTPLLRSSTATLSAVFIDPPPLGSPAHASSSYNQQFIMSSSTHSQSSLINVSHISADLRQEASSPSQSSSQGSYTSCTSYISCIESA